MACSRWLAFFMPVIIVAATNCAGDSATTVSGAPASALEYFEANPLSDSEIQALEDCLTERAGQTAIETPEQFQAYWRCSEDLGMFARVFIENDQVASDTDALTQQAARERKCLSTSGWAVIADDHGDGIIGWSLQEPPATPEERVRFQEDAEACGIQLKSGDTDDRRHVPASKETSKDVDG